MIIETQRLTIRSLKTSDIPEYAAVVADPQVTTYPGDEPPHTHEQATAYILTGNPTSPSPTSSLTTLLGDDTTTTFRV